LGGAEMKVFFYFEFIIEKEGAKRDLIKKIGLPVSKLENLQ